jgi:hypothetical protein
MRSVGAKPGDERHYASANGLSLWLAGRLMHNIWTLIMLMIFFCTFLYDHTKIHEFLLLYPFLRSLRD